MNEIDELIDILNGARVDYYKTYNKKVKAASIRLRRKLEEVSKKCGEIRKDVLDYRKDVIDPRNKERFPYDHEESESK